VPSEVEVAAKVQIRGLNFFYGNHQVLRSVTMDVPALQVTALIGPSGCGQTTLLRCLNRMHDLYPGNRYEGSIHVQPDGTDILGAGVDPIQVRMRFGMVFQKPNPFPKSIYENVAYGLRLQGVNQRRELDERVEKALREAALWDEAKSRLHQMAHNLSGGQQQRLCIARAIATDPDVVLFDEPTSALDPVMAGEVLAVMADLAKGGQTMVVVTHSMSFARGIATHVHVFADGHDVEHGPPERLFGDPQHAVTRSFLADVQKA
jgi:phosphate transport system ATP-binding protein